MNPSHYLTFLRILLSPVFPVLYLEREKLGVSLVLLPYIMLFLLFICECSDVLDGMLARRRNEVTDLGKVLDPMADSITHISLFLTFTQGVVALPLILVFIFLYRDMLITTLRTLCALRGVALAARFSGKMKAVLQAIVIFFILLLMIPYSKGWITLALFQQMSLFAVSVAAFYTVVSIVDYIYANWAHIKRVSTK
ncbi:MAG: CDP-diacylglycerol--glycerol-3-phosphate 3-phosphatidyltransferase [Chlamydiae bacterium RIFCSPHIGHO2_12_FULL_44_59]|nr:MAG: CDP-diacylglycerol--glycerol-3-phosphate 3-phosphatidyltransferase [Chlamydiae bacterium RIFCSPHIGHO2_01_FULL_44_39]OGN61011.1 MAG: CDP-diacylglycerol--glycerol-3-phosphate 3-phosphatidyltransferase [Chlamydiae bacterium RIFCSPHIGHO2_12_FULL_44_59]OGN66787.1 MAG: CDP-diacylglycerol--glycerol-3-phosphate 3-phosphatidyltransferase [Chlamydiae bacterium RIFCSPLOWO2_01_FULL_44_52]OGN69981.1 MAG: CDP-diacylglycerol--glycerol-3-phosphate 3-phosphatidyltransferase [Chlamydiae bacterium RIFCSPLO